MIKIIYKTDLHHISIYVTLVFLSKSIKHMEEHTNIIERLISQSKEYFQTRFELFELQVKQKFVNLVSGLLLSSMSWIFFLSFMLFINLGLAFLLSEYFKNNAIGFSLVAGFYFIAWLKIQLFRNFYKRILGNFMIKEISKNEQN